MGAAVCAIQARRPPIEHLAGVSPVGKKGRDLTLMDRLPDICLPKKVQMNRRVIQNWSWLARAGTQPVAAAAALILD